MCVPGGVPRPMSRWSAMALVAAIGLLSAVSRAYAARAYGPEEEALIRRGIEFRKALDDLAARAEFQKAYDLTHSPRAAAQLGLAEFALGRWEDADAHVGEALRVPSDPFITKYRGELEESLATIKSHIARVDVVGEPTGAEVFVNGRGAGQLPLGGPVSVSAGQVDVELRAVGFKRQSRTVTLAPGQYQRMAMRLEREGDSGLALQGKAKLDVGPTNGSAPTGTTDSPPSNTPRAAGSSSSVHAVAKWSALGLGGAGLATGIASTFVYRSSLHTFEGLHNRGCFDNGGRAVDAAGNSVEECQPSLDSYRTARTWAIVGFVGAGVFAATWLVLMLTEPERDGPSRSAEQSVEKTKAAMRWTCAPSPSVGVTCAAQF